MALTVWPALGTTIAYDKTTPGTYLPIGQVESIKIENDVGKVKTTHLLSSTQTYRPTLPDPGTITVSILYDPTDTGTSGTHASLKALQQTPAVHGWQITYPTVPPTTDTIQGFLTKCDRDVKSEESNLVFDFTVQCTGPLS